METAFRRSTSFCTLSRKVAQEWVASARTQP
jgi:hypothetical protein